TTTSLLGHILTDAGWDPTVIVGGRVHLLGAHARLGRSEYLICEADEFDRSFLTLHPVVAVITNVEAEHLDTYGTVAAMEDAFLEFTGRVPFYGVTVVCGDDAGVRRILPRLTRQVVTYGLGEDSEIRATDLRANTAGTRATLVRSGEELGEVIVPMPGRHMLLDAMAATTAALEAGVRFSTIATAIASFSGVARRFERKGERADVVLVDDYAHHPTEVAATLAAARQSFPTRRVVAVFQPHLFSRTRTFATAFATALGVADVVVVLPIYPARETPLPGVTHRLVSDALIAAGHSAVEVCDSFDD
ncbi:MAG: UDP-N-acetylmuramate--L-alanine ligase, partial [Acidobacteria bacterium]|nr:UDP-N-acetylmuramate--L-alanine ligase [Acidobacteriota bacterium]